MVPVLLDNYWLKVWVCVSVVNLDGLAEELLEYVGSTVVLVYQDV